MFAIGLIYFVYGCINYFIFSGHKQAGRELMLVAITWFGVGFIIFGFFALLNFLLSAVTTTNDSGDTKIDVTVEKKEKFLPLPNVPEIR